MNTYYFSLCGVLFRLDAGLPFPNSHESDSHESDLFSVSGGREDVRVTLEPVAEIKEPGGEACKSHREHPTWRDGSQIARCGKDLFRRDMHFRTDYSLADPSRLTCQVREADWIWATRSKYLWTGLMINQILLHHRALMLHASYVLHGSNGILFIGPSGMGKSTQARLWQEHRNARIVNGDKAGISLAGDPQVYGVPFSGSSGICYNVTAPLKAIVVLSQANENTVRRMGPSEAVAAICPNVFVDQAIAEEWRLALELVLQLVTRVPVYALACTPDEGAVEALEHAIATNGSEENRQ